MKTVASHQPCLLPWAGFWHKILSADEFVFSAGVPFSPRDLAHRVVLDDGSMLTIPVDRETSRGRICDVRIGEGFAGDRVADRLARTYCGRRYPHADRLEPILDRMRGASPGFLLADVLMELFWEVADQLEVGAARAERSLDHCTRVHWDDAPVDSDMPKTGKLVTRLSRHVPGPIEYLAGAGSRAYLRAADAPEYLGSVRFQAPVGSPPAASVLGWLVSLEDPRAAIEAAFTWEGEK